MDNGAKRGRRRVRMIDVAEQAGVSRTTASFVLNDRAAGIPEATRQRVLSIARQMGYEPNAAARSLVTGRTQRIGIVLAVPEYFLTPDLYFAHILSGVTAGNLRRDYNLLFHSQHYPDWRALRTDILSGGTDGVLLVGRHHEDPLTLSLLDAGFPTVCVSYQVDHPGYYSVDCDNEAGGELAVQHLLSLGHRHIALYHSGEGMSWERERRTGAEKALREAGIPAESMVIYEWLERSVEETVAAIKSSAPQQTALFCCDEANGHSLVEKLQEAGVRIPNDLSVVSFNSTDVSARSDPPLTSVYQPLNDIGATAVDMLVDIVENRPAVSQRRRFNVRLDTRQSTAALADGDE